MLASSVFFETSIPNTPSITVLSFHFISSARAPLRTTLYTGSALRRVPGYRPISKAELGKRGLIYGTGSRAKRPHRLTVLLAAQQNVFIRQAICNVQAPAEPGATLPALSFFGGFRTTAPVLVASSEMGRHPKPVTISAAEF